MYDKKGLTSNSFFKKLDPSSAFIYKVNNLIKVLKEEYICSLNETLSEHKYNDQKSYWKIIRSLIKGTKPSYNIYNGSIFPSLNPAKIVQFNSR